MYSGAPAPESAAHAKSQNMLFSHSLKLSTHIARRSALRSWSSGVHARYARIVHVLLSARNTLRSWSSGVHARYARIVHVLLNARSALRSWSSGVHARYARVVHVLSSAVTLSGAGAPEYICATRVFLKLNIHG